MDTSMIGGIMNPSMFQHVQKQAFDTADSDSSGSLSVEEFSSLLEEIGANGQTPTGSVEASSDELFSDADQNGDGQLSEEETQQHPQSVLSTMLGGNLSSSTLESLLLEQMFSTSDSDDSGSLTIDEFSSMRETQAASGMMPPPPPDASQKSDQDVFSDIDTDKDGQITTEELTSFHSSMKESRAESLGAGGMGSLLQFQEVDDTSLLDSLLGNREEEDEAA